MDHKKGSEEAIKDIVINTNPSLLKDQVEILIQLKAQVNTIDNILELHNFLIDEYEANEV